MNHRIKIDENRLLNNYEQMMDEIYLLYHTYPTCLTHVNLSEWDLAEMGEYDAVGRVMADSLRSVQGGKKKKVIHHGDPNYCNGLPRKR